MPRELTLQIRNKEYSVTPVKVDRKKLYGWTEVVALDEEGRPCQLVTTDDTGTLIIPKGGTALGIVSPEGEWVDRSTLVTVREDGEPAEPVPSSYSGVVKLEQKIGEDEFLDYSITDFYQLDGAPPGLVKAVGKGIYLFDYSYLDSYEATPAMLMASGGVLFMLLGYRNRFEMLCLGDCESVDEEDDDYIEVDDDDDLDFSMFEAR